MLQALVFDVDGTLSETEELHRRAFNETFRDFGCDWHWDRELYCALLRVAGGKERLGHCIRSLGPDPDFAAPRDEAVARLHAAKTTRDTELVAAGDAVLRPGVARLIREARVGGLSLSIATTTSLANVEALLAATLAPGALAMFDAVCAGDAVADKKPSPDVYLVALEALGLRAARAAGSRPWSPGRATPGTSASTGPRLCSTIWRRPAAWAPIRERPSMSRPCAGSSHLPFGWPLWDDLKTQLVYSLYFSYHRSRIGWRRRSCGAPRERPIKAQTGRTRWTSENASWRRRRWPAS